ncbi:sugar ABC transporter permease [Desertihabitans brevis]|uniref:Sugar ABC transporter permease n=1 Tax=Desertihabitans brevis TaxID=2268447 RepID=A0A367YU66_9ACTN|nr:sugar ABC transporter permease [Desertihabitans brevis]RCK69358.1 sugar ABC transporter permease [Desertihabitans brevis]
MSTLEQTAVRAPAAPTPGTAEPRRRRRLRPTQWIGVLFVLPATLYVVVYQLVPVVYGLVLSFTEYSPLSRSGPEWVGVANYLALVGDDDFARALAVTGQYVLMVLPPTVAIALGLAMLANRPFRGIGVFRSALYVPHIVSLTTVAVVWLWMYSPNGLFNEALTGLGLPPQSWLLEEDTAMPAVAAMRVWKALGSNMVLLLAGLQSIPRELYEAASTDGAGAWRRFRHITLPGLRPILTYVVAMDIIYLAQGFAELFILTGGGPLASTTTVNYLIYTEAFQYNSFGSASAMAFVLFAFIAAFSFLSIRGIAGRRS